MFKYPTAKQVVWFSVLAISAFLLLVLVLVKLFLVNELPLYIIFIIPVILAIPSYYILSYSLERFIYRRIKVIYKTISTIKDPVAKKMHSEDLKHDVISNVEQEVHNWTNIRSNEIEELKKEGKFRREFLGNVSHELKTPVFNIQGYIESLLEGGIHDDRINIKYLQRAGSNVDRLTKIIDDLEMISLLESNVLKPEMERFSIYELISEVIDDLGRMAEASAINLGVKDGIKQGIFVIANREQILQVMINLVTNSIKYGKKGGETLIGCYDMDKNVLIEVSDNGIGIAEKHLSRLFERFYVVNKARSKETGGTGLGLSIVKHIIEGHNQQINLRSTPGVGSTFGFTLRKS